MRGEKGKGGERRGEEGWRGEKRIGERREGERRGGRGGERRGGRGHAHLITVVSESGQHYSGVEIYHKKEVSNSHGEGRSKH